MENKIELLTPEELKPIIRPVLVEIAEATGLTLHHDGFSLVEPETAEVRVSVAQQGQKEWCKSQPYLAHVLHVQVERYKSIQFKLKISEYLPGNGYRAEVNMVPLLKRIKAVRGEAKEIAEADRLRRAREHWDAESRLRDIAQLNDWTGLEFKRRPITDHIYRTKHGGHMIDLTVRYDKEGSPMHQLHIDHLSLEQVNAMLQALKARVETES